MKYGGLGEGLLFPTSHLEKPVLNGLSDLLRLPQYPVLGVRASASAGVRREGELYAHVRAGASVGASVHETHTNWGDNDCLGGFQGCLRRFRSDRRRCRENSPLRPCDDSHNARSPHPPGKRASFGHYCSFSVAIYRDARRSSKRKVFLPVARHQPSLCKAFPACNLRW